MTKLFVAGNGKFESTPLQRRVRCEPGQVVTASIIGYCFGIRSDRRPGWLSHSLSSSRGLRRSRTRERGLSYCPIVLPASWDNLGMFGITTRDGGSRKG